ncbi:adhesion G protein-coupled receptor L4 isoform X2 [Pocillopora verrucosa]|uniref:adhesion G protein-coupled receptor L4 isoform X2 n=1 Tax=Pocillopora verrucosa TaxID=203993 RepID=UPI00333F3255
MMRPRSIFLFFASFYIMTQVFFNSLQALGDLIVTKGELLSINTTAPSINCSSSSNYTLTLQNRSSPHGSHLSAHIVLSGNIEFRRGSTVKVFGKYALSLESKNGNISICTDVNMTCGEEVFDTTCLGGFTQNSTAEIAGCSEKFYKGLGPGGLTVKENLPKLSDKCTPGASHGGYGGKKIKEGIFDFPEPYDRNNTASLLGGSGGSCIGNPGSVSGGGALELVADKGKIIVGAPIRAEAQNSSIGVCSGGSGGLIRLRAAKVLIHNNGKLIVDGGKGQGYNTMAGGAGGVIQIIAPEGYIAAETLSLKPGENYFPDFCEKKAEDGYFLLEANETAGTFNKTKPYKWPSRPNNGSTNTSSEGSTDVTVKDLLEKLQEINVSLWENKNINKSAILGVITIHQDLASTELLNKSNKELCLDTFKIYPTIMFRIVDEDPEFVKNTSRKLLKAANSCLDKKNHEFWKNTSSMPDLIANLQEVFVNVAKGNLKLGIDYTLTTEKILAVIKRKRPTAEENYIIIPDYSAIKDDSWGDDANFVQIPKAAVQSVKGIYTYVFLLYKDVESGLPNSSQNETGDELNVSSLVMSCYLALGGVPVFNLSSPVLLYFKTPSAEGRSRQCSFWNTDRSSWWTNGVKELELQSNSSITVCLTEHFTSFAVLMQHTKVELSEEDHLALSIITYIGCGVSTGALIITVIVFLSVESLSSERHKIHTNLVVSLLFANVLFLAGINETSSPVLCKVVAVSIHYFFLTAFTWMFVEGLHLYLKVVQVFRTENIQTVYYYVFGWGFSALPVAITFAIKSNSYGNSEVCWLSTKDGTIWAFIGPVVAIIAVNTFVLIMVIKTVVSSASAVKSSDHAHLKAGIKGLFVLMPLLGVGWILGLFALNDGTKVFIYAFSIVNGFQGLLIFLLHCVFNDEVRQAFRRQKEKHSLTKENISQYNAFFSLSSESGSKKTSNSNSFSKLKGRLSFKRKSSARVVQVQPANDNHDVTDSSFQVKRTFHESNRLSVTAQENKMSSLNCPMDSEREVAPNNQQAPSQKGSGVVLNDPA